MWLLSILAGKKYFWTAISCTSFEFNLFCQFQVSNDEIIVEPQMMKSSTTTLVVALFIIDVFLILGTVVV